MSDADAFSVLDKIGESAKVPKEITRKRVQNSERFIRDVAANPAFRGTIQSLGSMLR